MATKKKKTTKDETIEKLLANIKTGRRLSGGTSSEITEVIPTGITVLDRHVIGCGGLPVGRVTEMYSEEGGGKSSFLLACAASCQKEGGVAIIIETEDALQPERAETFGVNLDELILLEPSCMEEALEVLEETLMGLGPEEGPIFIGWDSLAATPTKSELAAGLVGGQAVADRARLMSRAARVLGHLVSRRRIAFLIINQTRTKVGVMFGDPMVTPGGQAVKFLSSLRLRISGGKAVKDDFGDHTAKDVIVTASKNRMSPPWRKCRVRLDFEKGFDDMWTTIDFAKDRKLLKPRSRGKKAEQEALKALGWAEEETND